MHCACSGRGRRWSGGCADGWGAVAARGDVFSGLLASAAADAPLLAWSALAGLWGFTLKALYDSWGGWPRHQRAGLLLAVGLWFGAGALGWEHT